MKDDSKKEYKKASTRKLEVLAKACVMAKGKPYHLITRDDLARIGNTATGNISRIMGGMDGFRKCIVDYAIDTDCSHVIAQAINLGSVSVRGMSKKDRKRHLMAIL